MSFSKPCTAVFLAVMSTLAATVIHPRYVRAEFDHLTCFRVKQDDAMPVVPPLSLTTYLGGASGCEIKTKAKTVCVRTEKNGGNDPRGPSLPNAYVCYKIKCDSPPSGTAVDLLDQFSGRIIELKKIYTLCAPAN